MGSTDNKTSIFRVVNILEKWDKGTTNVRKRILQDFLAQNQNINTYTDYTGSVTGPDVEHYFADAASLFLIRITAWLRLMYP